MPSISTSVFCPPSFRHPPRSLGSLEPATTPSPNPDTPPSPPPHSPAAPPFSSQAAYPTPPFQAKPPTPRLLPSQAPRPAPIACPFRAPPVRDKAGGHAPITPIAIATAITTPRRTPDAPGQRRAQCCVEARGRVGAGRPLRARCLSRVWRRARRCVVAVCVRCMPRRALGCRRASSAAVAGALG
ncbi:hypothetical protein OBBRIDRAFT_836064 [Obba rivulosa]|uniref:Uncharacterized protein n=1 Tax=Obba rivulosa TaxID=1052685 RepID=A0A8E2AVH1_9APHY|nr:hypothetical protein OBBRIDRAFT_836064 [Obba rivulosa]